MTELEVRRCPVCGAPVAAGAASCDYCAAPLETVRCAACFVQNSADAIHCAGCGQKLGLQPLETPVDLACPSCKQTFHAFGSGHRLLCECARCGGQFVEHELLNELLERRELHRTVPRPPPPRENPANAKVRYLACPRCGSLMNRHNFGDSSGIVVDVCARHGVWFDAGELPRILEFVQAGGLERARERKVAELKQAERDLRVAASVPTSETVREDPFGWRSLGQEALELLDFIVDTLRKRRS